jgi:flagellar protein FliJ
MKSIKQIIKFKKKQLDDQKTRISFLEQKLTQIVEQIHAENKKVTDETSFVEKENDYMFLFSSFFAQSIKNVEKLSLEVKNILAEIAQERAMLLDLFAEVKKFEILLQRHQEKQRHIEKTRETKFFDEISITRYNKDN